jgi:hypothetical protein
VVSHAQDFFAFTEGPMARCCIALPTPWHPHS